jgi:Tfp pilus assembly protein PilN
MFERINLVPQQALSRRIKKTTPVVVGILLCLAVGVVLVLAQRLDRQMKAIDKEIQALQLMDDAVKSRQVVVQQLTGSVKQLGEEEKQLQEMVVQLARIPEQKQSFSALLDAVAFVLPPTVRCEKISLGAKSGQISGQATIYRDLPAFVQKLGEIPRLRNVSLSVLNQEQKKDMDILAFSIVFELQEERVLARK